MRLPIVFVLQNNQVALGTRVDQHHRMKGFAGWAKGYGMQCLSVDGNNVLDMVTASKIAVRACRDGRGPVAIAAETFRMGGHATHDEREARETFSEELFREWGRKDPVGMFEEALLMLPACREANVTRQTLEASADLAEDARGDRA